MADATEVVRRVEQSDLKGLGEITVEDLYTHIDSLMNERPGPLELFRRWERQQWSASDLDFSVDVQHWRALDPVTQQSLEEFFAGFFVGEQMVTDTLAPIVSAAPDEESRLFLSTQIADEARHSFFFSRFYTEVLGAESFQAGLARAREWTGRGPFYQVFDQDLVGVTDALRSDPSDQGLWVEALTLYHMMVEGILALVGQRQLLQFLRETKMLPAFRTGFTAVTRDESRHVNFGVWALQGAVSRGFEANIRKAVDKSLKPCLQVYADPDSKVIIPLGLDRQTTGMFIEQRWKFGIDSLVKRLRAAGVDPDYLAEVDALGWSILGDSVDEYESNWSEAHPVRSWKGRLGMVSG